MRPRHITITPQIVDWILYNMPAFKEKVEEIELRTSASLVVFSGQPNNADSAVEIAAIERAAISQILDVANRGIRALHPEQRKIYRMKYRANMTYKEIGKRLHISEETVYRRVGEIREIISQYLRNVPESVFINFLEIMRKRA
ncbi:MAG: sigma-70 family RNA polymerase sigma factor [Thermovenabulum sp.]|uniref:sigma-70 family RNA polymerase sigma factor n=1 Tax=Thermovenabulum sp. TaxID=3100335 RepID=UPI003C7A4B4E